MNKQPRIIPDIIEATTGKGRCDLHIKTNTEEYDIRICPHDGRLYLSFSGQEDDELVAEKGARNIINILFKKPKNDDAGND